MDEKFWAKTGKGKFRAEGSPEYHPVICHLADTAAVAMEIVRSYLSPAAVSILEAGLGVRGEALVRCCGFLAGCHDLGKISPAFQFQVSEVGKALVGEDICNAWLKRPDSRQKTPHGTVTAATLPEFLLELGVAKRLANQLARIVGGHHGFFPSSQDVQSASLDNMGRGPWKKFRQDIYEQLRGYVGLTKNDLPTCCNNAGVMLLAGLTTVSDWIASNADAKAGFPYANDTPFAEYALSLPAKAKNALSGVGWTRPPAGEVLTFGELFPDIHELRELQKHAVEIAPKLVPPCLVLVEASMGEGKTEAALYLADYLQHQSSAGGFYLGLPTQATSNAMWKRVRKFLRQRYPENVVNLTLSHSAATLKVDYLQSVCRLDQVYDREDKVIAGEWHTARKRTLLSPYGVGTLDQGLMGAVRSRHQFVRLFGLAGRVVILDEIHAYDLYTSTLLERFLEWLALLGSPVVALSATLPRGTRQALVNAYAKGCGLQPQELPSESYPRITTFPPAGDMVQTFEASDHVQRSLEIRWIDDQVWASELQRRLTGGGCVAVICSTVNRAQAVYSRLKDLFAADELGLFHGRFLFIDRERIENDCLQKFGREGERPHRYVLVATQVIEQSLDVDFDLLISDMAPVDLLLQRSGRLHRHSRTRPEQLQQPTLWLVSPIVSTDEKVNFSDSGYIYDRHILLRTWLTLRNALSIMLPEETDSVIESVYNLTAPIAQSLETVHAEDWKQSLEDYCLDCDKRKTCAEKVQLPPARVANEPYQFTYQGEEDSEQAIARVTRLGRPSITTIFLKQMGSKHVFPGTEQTVDLNVNPDLEQIRALLSYSTRISKRGLFEKLLEHKNTKSWTSALLRNCCYVVLDSQNSVCVGPWKLLADDELGIVIQKV